MGSKLVVALATQLGRIFTNSTGASPSTSRPIEQQESHPIHVFQALQQVDKLRTAFQGSTEFSKPIEQQGVIQYGANPVIGRFIQQVLIDPDPNYTRPIEQVIKWANVSAEQLELSTGSVANTSRPLQQEPVIDNNVQVTQYDFIELIFPLCGSIKNPVNTDIRWRILDFGFPFNVSSLIFKISGVEVQDRPEFTVTSIANGLELYYNPPQDFPYNYEVQIILQISDTATSPNTFFYRCSWKTTPDTKAPVFSNIYPPCDAVDVSTTATVSFDVVDVGEGVDPQSVIVAIEGVTVCSGLSLESLTTLVSGTGYHVTYTHPDVGFNFESEVTMAFQASDLADPPNSSLFVCAFNTVASTPPVFLNTLPAPCDTFVDNNTGLTFEVYGVEHGVDISTLEVRVDNSLRRVVVAPRIYRAS